MINLALASAADAPILSRLHGACFGPKGWDARGIADMLAVSGTHAILALPACGFILFRILGGGAEILTLAVDPAARRKGIGKTLVAAMLERARDEGAGETFLEVREDYPEAIALYRSEGFEPLRRRLEYYRNDDGSSTHALVLTRTL